MPGSSLIPSQNMRALVRPHNAYKVIRAALRFIGDVARAHSKPCGTESRKSEFEMPDGVHGGLLKLVP